MTHTYSPAQLAQGKASLANTIGECDYALADIRKTIDAFSPDTGGHLRYLNKLYEERDAYIARRAELTRSPSLEMQVEILANTLRLIGYRAQEGLRGGHKEILFADIYSTAREAIHTHYLGK